MGQTQSTPEPEPEIVYPFPTANDVDISEYVSSECDVRNKNNWNWSDSPITYKKERCLSAPPAPKKSEAPRGIREFCNITNASAMSVKCYSVLASQEKTQIKKERLFILIPLSLIFLAFLLYKLKFEVPKAMFYSIFIIPALFLSPFVYKVKLIEPYLNYYLQFTILSTLLTIGKVNISTILIKLGLLAVSFLFLSYYYLYPVVFSFELLVGEIMTFFGLDTGNRATIMQSYWAKQKLMKEHPNSGNVYFLKSPFGAVRLFNQQSVPSYMIRLSLLGFMHITGILDVLYKPLDFIAHIEKIKFMKKFV
jgi:hypothetical protein